MTNGAELGFLLDPTLEALFAALVSRLDVHLFIEGIFVVVLCYLLFQKSYKPRRRGDDLTEKEIDELCDAWQPDPLASGPLMDQSVPRKEKLVTAQGDSKIVIDGIEHVNMSCLDFLNCLGHKEVQDACEHAIRKYGVGACGPRGFYGTIDVHLELEDKLAEFMGTEAGIIYSYDIATVASVIPAFLKRGDLVICDEAVNWAVQNGLDLSRSYIKEFKHNDVADLERILMLVAESEERRSSKALNRRFIIVEGLYQSTGQIAPMPEIVELANKYKFRVLLEETCSFGALGPTGRGVLEHHGMKSTDVSLICASMSGALATVGGFCVSDKAIVSHQRLSSASYCFSASLPPFNATAALEAIRLIENDKPRLARLRENTKLMHKELVDATQSMDQDASDSLTLLGDVASPLKHLYLRTGTDSRQKDDATLQQICDLISSDARIAVAVSDFTPLQKRAPKPSIRVTVSAGHTAAQISQFGQALRKAAAVVFNGRAS
mmetsp:Transcript_10601/g.20965  ORF Transcript_10601/g.20965 Transcript_10601/m.20965 type:complete len:493 (-) Transcript_10601:362-1840(-)|eukprot:CAMPEP_0173413178 /NCGR_PEP_ID=MMETSP1356-20130122/81361_1 /TAXON_ID=77927 ORGANISM="Hemiselmis virescens, Strain PCC157" /NCGR_SAMPLE_ID=MMETSP1356 /ASSEMBLY_ACC=CAM_ASM_000847 /LENGTH=492 /DNA_ID=CAMNT_0014375181 /DNA_START=321 /DNA_END=1799 /DNA_ORIENTATION=+